MLLPREKAVNAPVNDAVEVGRAVAGGCDDSVRLGCAVLDGVAEEICEHHQGNGVSLRDAEPSLLAEDVNATECVNGENLPLHRILSERSLANVPHHVAAKI